jgi:virginiamycin B lyase
MYKLPLLRTAVVLVLALAAIASPATAAPKITEYELPAEFALPNDLTTGPDGAMWVTDSSLGRIWRITTKGKIRSYDLGQMPGSITTAHGAMWVADSGGDAIHRVTTDGRSTRYALPTGSFPTSIVAGPDGALWFTENRADQIGRLALDGTITHYPIPTKGGFPGDMAVGSDGALYFSEPLANKIGRVTTSGQITEYAVPGDNPMPGPIVSGPDGALYVGERNANVISRMTTAGEFTDAFPIPRENADPLDMVAGPDGALWISEFASGHISRMTYDGTFTKKYRVGRFFVADALTFGPDGAIWFNEGSDGTVGRLDIGYDPAVTAEGTSFSARVGVSAKRTVATFTDADPNARARDYDVTINWGDGSTSDGTVQRIADGSFEVRGRHTYSKAGTRKVVVKITDGVGKGLDAKVESRAYVTR